MQEGKTSTTRNLEPLKWRGECLAVRFQDGGPVRNFIGRSAQLDSTAPPPILIRHVAAGCRDNHTEMHSETRAELAGLHVLVLSDGFR